MRLYSLASAGDLVPADVLAERRSALRRRVDADLVRLMRIEAGVESDSGASFRCLTLRRGIPTARETIA
jgi:hypothetical protein